MRFRRLLLIVLVSVAVSPAARADESFLTPPEFLSLYMAAQAEDKPEVAADLVARHRYVVESIVPLMLNSSIESAAQGNAEEALTWHLTARVMAEDHARIFGSNVLTRLADAYDRWGPEQLEKKAAALALSEMADRAQSTASFDEATALLNRALELEREIGDRWGEGGTLSNLFVMHYARGDFSEASRLGEAALTILREVGDRWSEGIALGNLGLVHTERGEFSTALEFHRKALEIKRDARDRAGEGITLSALGQLYDHMGKYREAVGFNLQALEASREMEDKSSEGIILGNLGLSYMNLGESAKARQTLDQAVAVQERSGDRRGLASTLLHLGSLTLRQGQPAEARRHFEESLRLNREIGASNGEVESLEQVGALEEHSGNYGKAKELYDKALELSRKLGMPRLEASLLHDLGGLAVARGDFPSAIAFFEQALEGYRRLGNRSGEAEVLLSLGIARRNTGDTAAAEALFGQGLEILRAVGDRQGEAMALSSQANLASDLGRLREAVDLYTRALAIVRELGHRAVEPAVLTHLGIVHRQMGDFATAQRLHREAADLARQTESRSELADALRNLGVTLSSQSDFAGALEVMQQSLDLYKQLGDRVGEAGALANLGQIEAFRGDYTAAVKLLREALSLQRAAGVPGGIGTSLEILSGVYGSLGDSGRALETAREAHDILHRAGLVEEEAAASNQIGNLLRNAGDPAAAAEAYEKALAIDRSTGDRAGEAATLINLGSLDLDEGRTSEALARLEGALSITRELGLRREEGAARTLLADIYLERGEAERSLAEASRSLEIFQETGVGENLFRPRLRIGRALEKLGKKPEALAAYRQTAAEVEAIRGNVRLEWERTLFLFPISVIYVDLIDLLMDLHAAEPARGYDREAFRYVQMAKARSLRDLLEGASLEAKAKVPPELLERRRDLARRIVTLETEMRHPKTAGAPPQDLGPALEALEREESQVVEQIRTGFPEYAALAQPQPVAIEALQQQVLRQGELLLEYFLTPRRVLLFTVTPDGFRLSESKEPLRNNRFLTFFLRGMLLDPELWDLEQLSQDISQNLYAQLLQPVESELQRAETVYIAPDSFLHYLPFEILGRDGKLLVDAPFSLSYIPSASVLETLRRRQPPRADRLPLLVVADPVGWDAPGGVGGPADGKFLADLFGATSPCSDLRFSPLPYAGGEALALAGLYGLDPGGQEVRLREKATEASLKEMDLQRFRYLHFATHGVLCDDGNASALRSSLVLSTPAAGAAAAEPVEDGLLDVNEIFGLSLDADLVTLSACQTGLGSDVVGEGLVGLTQAFLYAGSRSVLVSLWSVEDRSTALFMKHFYRNLRRGMSRGAALRETKRWMLYESYDVDPYGNQIRHAHPFYWAPFILIGSQD